MSEMAVDYHVRLITVEEYHRMGEAGVFAEGERLELLDGELIVMAPNGPGHGFTVRSLLKTFVERFGKRAIVDVGQSVVLGNASEPQPDLCFSKSNRVAIAIRSRERLTCWSSSRFRTPRGVTIVAASSTCTHAWEFANSGSSTSTTRVSNVTSISSTDDTARSISSNVAERSRRGPSQKTRSTSTSSYRKISRAFVARPTRSHLPRDAPPLISQAFPLALTA